MSDTDDPKLKAFAEAVRLEASKPDATPQFKALAEDVIARVKRSPAYYYALGSFVSEFSKVETTLHSSLTIFAGVKHAVAQAIFGGLKVEGRLQTIKRISDAKNWEPRKKERLDEIVSRLGPINKLRNDILHYGASLDLNAEDSWLVTNKEHVHIAEKIRETSVTPKLLEDASADLRKIFFLIIALSFDDISAERAPSIETEFEEFLKPAWRYKSPQPARKVGKSQQTRQKPPRQHRASRGKP